MYNVRDVSDLANEFIEKDWNLTHFEALQLSIQLLQVNAGLDRLDMIGMAIGYSPDGGSDGNPSCELLEHLRAIRDHICLPNKQ